jgi:hypothetical protein
LEQEGGSDRFSDDDEVGSRFSSEQERDDLAAVIS